MALTEKIIYTNSLGQILEFNHIAPFYLVDYSGFGQPNNTITSSKQYGTDGEQFNQQTLDYRDLDVDVVIQAVGPEILLELKRVFIDVLNPKLHGKLTYKTEAHSYEIDVILLKGLDESDSRGKNWQSANLQFRALSPFWRDTSDYIKKVDMSDIENKLKFDLSIQDQFEFATSNNGQIVNIQNYGSTPIGAIFTFEFVGETAVPEILNVVTNEYFGFDETFETGDKLVVSTIHNDKHMTWTKADGKIVNLMVVRKAGSTFLQLDNTAANYLQVKAVSGIENVKVTVEYYPLLLGV
ncbi:MAG: phage tail family protein [Lactobacillaceae bacterium]|jgi:hypothetical protein|nr:phage tail family protein [Lactobacillaceae bacterium]